MVQRVETITDHGGARVHGHFIVAKAPIDYTATYLLIGKQSLKEN